MSESTGAIIPERPGDFIGIRIMAAIERLQASAQAKGEAVH